MFSARNISKLYHVTKRFYGSNSFRNPIKSRTPVLYGDEVSPPVRFVLMTAAHLELKLIFHKIDLFLGENKMEFYTKINPLQKVPALDTGTIVIRDSHAIALYLCRQVSDNNLYPEETSMRAQVEEMLYFNACNLFPIDSSLLSDYFAGKPVNCDKVDHWHKLLDLLDSQLKSCSWLAGDKMTLGDLCCAATISSLGMLVPLTERHSRVAGWMKRLEQDPCFEINSRGLRRLADMMSKS